MFKYDNYRVSVNFVFKIRFQKPCVINCLSIEALQDSYMITLTGANKHCMNTIRYAYVNDYIVLLDNSQS